MIELLQITLENFASYRKRVSVGFSTSPGLRFLTGTNEVEPLGANGAGKSTLFESAVWCWYGTLSSGEKASSVTNETEKRPYVGTKLLVSGEPVHIERWGNPNKIQVNGQTVAQDSVNEILRRTHTQITQSVIFGQNAPGQPSPFFYDLSIPERGELLDDVLQLDLWENCSTAASKKEAEANEKIRSVDRSLATNEGKAGQIKREIQELTKQQKEWAETHEKFVEGLIQKVEQGEKELEKAQLELVLFEEEEENIAVTDDDSYIDRLRSEIEAIRMKGAVTKSNIDDTIRLLEFYKNNKNCPTCGQPLTSDFVHDKKTALYCDLGKLDTSHNETTTKVQELQSELVRVKGKVEVDRAKAREAHTNVLNARHKVSTCQKEMDTNNKRAAEEIGKTNPFSTLVATSTEALLDTEKQIATRTAEKQIIEGERLEASFWKGGFKRVRLFIVNRITDILSVETTAVANSLGLVGWRIEFRTETETKSGTTKSGIQVITHAPNSVVKRRWSGGEGQRIRLAVSLGIARTLQRLSGNPFNLLVLDEPTQYLSSEGVNDLVFVLQKYAETNNLVVWLIDQRTLEVGSFAETWRVVKDESGSRVEKMET